MSDAQYGTFRANLPYTIALLLLHPPLRRLYEALRPISTQNVSSKPNGRSSYISAAGGEARLQQRASFDFGFALIFLTALHGFSALKILLILYTNFSIGTRLPRKYVPAATWIFNVGTLFANELSEGYKLTKIVTYIDPLGGDDTFLYDWAVFLESYGGVMPRWEILFNITVLRQISFNLDYYWSLDRRAGSPEEVRIIQSLTI